MRPKLIGQRTNQLITMSRKEKMKEELLFGKYRILKLLANGSGGEVFLAEHDKLGERRVIKRILKNRPFYVERKREAYMLRMLHHSAIPRIYDIEEDETACYMIEEDMGGETLKDFLLGQKCLPTSFISHYSIQLCEIIEYLHQNGILYLDVKPDNILICGDRLFLIDFGGAIQRKEYSGVIFGTDGYAAPEQYNGAAEERSDVYGIGCVLGILLGERSKERKELFRIYEKCVQKIPEKRYQNVSSLKEDLQMLLGQTREKRFSKSKRYPKYIGVIGVHAGAESGALCTLLASQLNGREKGRIACIDLSKQQIFGQLYESLYGEKKTVPERFMMQGICYVTEGTSSMANLLVSKGYSTVILHFGMLSEEYREDFFRCDCRLVMGNLYPWRLQEWREFSERLLEMGEKHDVTVVLTGGEKELLPFRPKRVIELPYIEDVLIAGRIMEKTMQKCFD